MARGDIIIFNEAKAFMIDGGWDPADVMKCAILDNTVPPAAADVTPQLGDYTEVGAAGSYVAGGTSLGTLDSMVTQTAGTLRIDSATNPTWAKNAANDVDAHWALIYNDTDVAKRAMCYVDLGGPVDMTAGDLTINWPAGGIISG